MNKNAMDFLSLHSMIGTFYRTFRNELKDLLLVFPSSVPAGNGHCETSYPRIYDCNKASLLCKFQNSRRSIRTSFFSVLAFLFLCLTVPVLRAQSTSVSGNVSDASGQAWFGGTYQFSFYPSPTNPIGPYFINGTPFDTGTTISGSLDSSGNYSASVPPNTSISPSGSLWTLTVCPQATYKCYTQNYSVTGVSQTVSPVPPAITIDMSQPHVRTAAYADTEIINANLGITYFNLLDNTIHICNSYPCGWISAAISSLATGVNAPQNTQLPPYQVGPDWYAGTASGLCPVPAAPTVSTESAISVTGNFDSSTTYYVVVTGLDRNGETTKSAETSYKPASGSTNTALVKLSGYSYRAGCYAYRTYIGTSSGGPYYLASAYTSPASSISSWSCTTTKLCTVTTSAGHGFLPGEYVTISGATTGGSATTINGSFTLVAQQGSSPTTFFFFRSSATSDSASAGGTATVTLGFGSDATAHMAPGDMIISTVPVSGTQPPSSNTAKIDAIQVALNATCNYAAGTCANGELIVPQGSLTLTTPLIVSNQQTVTGVNTANAKGKSQLLCPWADPNLGCVMRLGGANGVRIQNLDIQSSGNGLMITGQGAAYAGSNNFFMNNNITANSTSGTYSAVIYRTGVWYEEHWTGNLLTGDLACVLMQGISGGFYFYSKGRWQAANLSAQGLFTNGLLGYSAVTDPDRGQNRGGFSNGASMVEVSDLILEVSTGVAMDCINLGCKFRNFQTADSSALSGAPALVQFGADANAGGSSTLFAFEMEDSVVFPTGNVPVGFQFTGGQTGIISFTRSSMGGTIDLQNNSPTINCIASPCRAWGGATVGDYFINVGVSARINVYAAQSDGSSNSGWGQNMFNGGIRLLSDGSSGGGFPHPDIYLETYNYNGSGDGHGNAGEFWFQGTPATVANQYKNCQAFGSGARCKWLENDGSTALLDLNAQAGANQINLCSSSGTNSQLTVGCTMNAQMIIPSADHTYALGSLIAPTSGWVSLILSANGSETALQGNASWAGIGNNKTVYLPPGPSTMVGVPFGVGLDQTGVSTANSGSPQSILATVPVSGQYRVSIYVDQSAGCATVGAGSLTVVLGWTDGTNARVSATLTLTPGTAATGTSSYVSATQFIWAAASSAITVTDTYTACSVGTWTYDQHATVERTE